VTRPQGVMAAAMIAAAWSPCLGQTNSIPGTANNALAACVQAADQKYKDTWDALCGQMGKPRRCADFLGSPRDREFSQLRVEEMTLCSKLYR
jgi:hypothetical protein